MGAMIARREVYMKAYGTPKTAMIHAAATFGGIGEARAYTPRGRTVAERDQDTFTADVQISAAGVADYDGLVAALQAVEAMPDATFLYWDVRPSARYIGPEPRRPDEVEGFDTITVTAIDQPA